MTEFQSKRKLAITRLQSNVEPQSKEKHTYNAALKKHFDQNQNENRNRNPNRNQKSTPQINSAWRKQIKTEWQVSSKFKGKYEPSSRKHTKWSTKRWVSCLAEGTLDSGCKGRRGTRFGGHSEHSSHAETSFAENPIESNRVESNRKSNLIESNWKNWSK